MSRWPGAAARLAGRRVVLEPLADEHAGELSLAARDSRIWEWMEIDASTPRSFAALFGHMMGASRAGEEVPFAVRDRRSGALVGSSSYLALAPEHKRLEVGSTWYSPDVWGTGVNADCKLLLLGHAFERLGCVRVELKTDARNERSRAAMLAFGATFEGIFRKHMQRGYGVRDTAWYSVIDDEWPAVRARLEERARRT